MFGALRCNKDAGNNLEYFDLSGNRSVGGHSYAVLICDQCREQKLTCSGDRICCRRCRDTFNICTYHGLNRSMEQSSSRHRQSASDPNHYSKPVTKRQETNRNANGRPASEELCSIQMDVVQSLSSADLDDGFWTPATQSGRVYADLRDWGNVHSKEAQELDLGMNDSANAFPLVFPLPELRRSSLYPVSAAMSSMDENVLNSLVMTPPATNATTISMDTSDFRSGQCGCIRSLADMLEKISGDGGSNIDDLLVCLRDGVETCKQVLPCNNCSVTTTNSMIVVTVVQQLATISQDLCFQLIKYQQKVKTASTIEAPPHLINAEIYIGKYQVRTTSLHLETVLPIASMHIKDLQKLLRHLLNDIKQGTKAFTKLTDAANVAARAFSDLQNKLQLSTIT